MRHNTFTPASTLKGIARQATNIKRQLGIPYTAALEKASVLAGYQNYRHAKRALEKAPTLKPLFLTAYWHDRHGKTRPFSGRITAMAMLPEPVHQCLQTLKVRGRLLFNGFDLECTDHLRVRHDIGSLDAARKAITDALRELQFCQATGLRRIYTRKNHRRVSFLHELPARDHASYWDDTRTGSWLMLDEPYQPAVDAKREKRAQWISDHNLHQVAPNWGGLYLPGRATPYLLSTDAELVQRISQTVERLPELPAIDWETHSGDYHSEFISPQRQQSTTRYRPRPKPSYLPRGGARPYNGFPGRASSWRPDSNLSIEQHRALGATLQGLLRFAINYHMRENIQTWISRLDDWAELEHPNESHDVLNGLYYNSPTRFSSMQDALPAIAEARAQAQTYNACKPRTDLLKMLDAVEAGLVALQAKTTQA